MALVSASVRRSTAISSRCGSYPVPAAFTPRGITQRVPLSARVVVRDLRSLLYGREHAVVDGRSATFIAALNAVVLGSGRGASWAVECRSRWLVEQVVRGN